MTSAVTDEKTTAAPRRRERTAEDIITAARTAPAKVRGVWLLGLLSSFLLWAAFPPLDLGPLAFLAPVPLLMLARLERRPRWTYCVIYLCGFAFHVAALWWMRLGDATMYSALFACSLYMAIYHPLFLWLCRVATLRYRVPLVVAAPVFWVAVEFCRARVMTGFGWYFLSHTQYRWLELIQISDVTGAYGVSFLVMLSAAALSLLVPPSLFRKLKLVPAEADERFAVRTPSPRAQWIGLGVTLVGFAVVLAYGYARRAQATWTRPDAEPGPRVALVQGNFVADTSPTTGEEIVAMRRTHYELTGRAVRFQPDVIAWPEAMYPYPPLREISPNLSDADLKRIAPEIPVEWWREGDAKPLLSDMAQQANASLLIGINAYAVSEEGGYRHYNSVAHFHPSFGYRGRYDKLHRVPFGEYIPMRETLPFLHEFTPYGFGFGIQKGAGPVAFTHGEWSFAPLICFESSVAHLVREVVRSKPVDVLVNASNDGWFHGSSELEQHLITAAFRSVETRTPMVRAVNTGISAFVDGDGAIVEPEVFFDADGGERESMKDPETGAWHKQLNAVLVHDVPLDGRTSLYVRYGDWFATTCLAGMLMCLIGGLLPRRRSVGVRRDATARE